MNKGLSFEHTVVKDNAVNNDPVEAGDSVTLILKNENNAYEAEAVVVTDVSDDARYFCWDVQAEDIYPDEVLALHNKHIPGCAAS